MMTKQILAISSYCLFFSLFSRSVRVWSQHDPIISIATSLYLITGDSSYLTKAEAIYA